MSGSDCLSIEVVIRNKLGMHARPAARIARMAMAARRDIWVSRGTIRVDATSIIDLLTLGAVTDSRIRIHAESEEDRGILEEIRAFFEDGFGEETE